MIEYWETAEWKMIAIDKMSTEHLLNAINYIKYSYDDTRLEYMAWQNWEWFEEREEREDRIHRQYQAMHNELVVRLAKKFLLDSEDKLPDLPF